LPKLIHEKNIAYRQTPGAPSLYKRTPEEEYSAEIDI
jgi:hypothetical protein